MRSHRIAGRLALVLVAAVVFASAQGCAVGKYLQYRGEDALEMVDLGLTITTTPQWAFYWNSLDLLVFGASELDGYVVGIGGGKVGVVRHYNKCYGLIVSSETHGWGDFDKDDESTMISRTGGLLGLAGVATGTSHPAYTPACVHYFPHIGYVGVVWTARWFEMVDFAVGFTTIDLAGDDGYKIGKWSFPWRDEA